jgi:outer membrane murein-binding lipoprotein Lpp
MNKTIESVIISLEGLGKALRQTYAENSILSNAWGWNHPPLSTGDLAHLLDNLSYKLKLIEFNEIDKELEEEIAEIPKRVEIFKSSTLPFLSNSNALQAISVYSQLVLWITNTLDPLFSWETIKDTKVLPNQISKKLRSIQSEINEIVPNKEDLKRQIDLINNAVEAAENLPTDLEALKDARNKVNKLSTDTVELYGKIDVYYKMVEDASEKIKIKKEEADKLVAQCEEAYKITTTKGLAAAFDQRANKLSTSMWFWVAGLLSALGIGIYISSQRFELLYSAMNSQKPTEYIWIQLFLSFLSLGAPIWFAWIATRQIGERFKLSEDYAFKSSVAKAYEGYRKEAARIDKDLELRLFSSALSRLEEAPLRLMETQHYGSPLHELISSRQKKVVENASEPKNNSTSMVTNKN